MKVEGPSNHETKDTDSKGSVGRHFGLASAHGQNRTVYLEAKRRAKEKLAAAMPWWKKLLVGGAAGLGLGAAGLSAYNQLKQAPATGGTPAPAPAGPPTSTAPPAAPAPQPAAPAASPAPTTPAIDPATAALLRGATGHEVGTGSAYTPDERFASPMTGSAVSPYLRQQGKTNVIGDSLALATLPLGGRGWRNGVVGTGGTAAAVVGSIGAGRLLEPTATDIEQDSARPTSAARSAENWQFAGDTTGLASGAAFDAMAPVLSTAARTGLNAWQKPKDVSTYTEAAGAVPGILAARGLLTAGGVPAAGLGSALPAGVLALHANRVLHSGLRNLTTEEGQQDVVNQWRNQVLADRGRTQSEVNDAANQALLQGAMGNTAASGAAVGRAFGKNDPVVQRVEQGFLADADSAKHYQERKAQYKQMYQEQLGGSDTDGAVSDHLAHLAATRDSQALWRSRMNDNKPVRVGSDATQKFPADSPVRQQLGALANQIGYSNLKHMLADPNVGPELVLALAEGKPVNPADYGINTDAYAYRK